MEKRIFYFFTAFVLIFTIGAWQYAAAEIEDLQEKTETSSEKAVTEKVQAVEL